MFENMCWNWNWIEEK